jgi:putative membrane protein insertion efficiency factor
MSPVVTKPVWPGLCSGLVMLIRQIACAMLRAYKKVVSPLLPASCRYTPTCSEYAQEAIERHGVIRGGCLAAWRLLRCNPLAGSGYDPVRNGAGKS